MNNYMCHKCKTLVQKNSKPAPFNCPAGSMHQWTDLGPTGNDSYQCNKCGTVVKSAKNPTPFHCPGGTSGSSHHYWVKL